MVVLACRAAPSCVSCLSEAETQPLAAPQFPLEGTARLALTSASSTSHWRRRRTRQTHHPGLPPASPARGSLAEEKHQDVKPQSATPSSAVAEAGGIHPVAAGREVSGGHGRRIEGRPSVLVFHFRSEPRTAPRRVARRVARHDCRSAICRPKRRRFKPSTLNGAHRPQQAEP